MYKLSSLTINEMVECIAALQALSGGSSMEESAQKIVRYLYENFGDAETGEKSCALVRFYKTHPCDDLPRDIREFAKTVLGDEPATPDMKCLTLLATAGEKPEWNSRKTSVGHKAIPLPSEQMVLRFPMISQLIHELGVEVKSLLKADPAILVEMAERPYQVFLVTDALGSPYVPAQTDFVVPFKIKSVVGCGGVLPSGSLFAVIVFSKVFIPRAIADLFRAVALTVKMLVLPFDKEKIFA